MSTKEKVFLWCWQPPLAGDTVMVTRRILRRHHLFRPDPPIRQLHLYALAVCLLTEQAMVEKLERQEREARAEVKARGWSILGAARVRRLSPYRRATSFELLRDRNPTFAVGSGQRKVFFRAVAELRAFRSAYRQALEQWRAGRQMDRS